MEYCPRKDAELKLFPGARELGQPLFATDAAYQRFREEFYDAMRPACADSERKHALSAHEARLRLRR